MTTSERVLLACGHAANATHSQGHDGLPDHHPSCAIDAGLGPREVGVIAPSCRVVEKPSLEGRRALCSYKSGRNGESHVSIPSDWDLAFFEHKPDAALDAYYCGCWGWD